MSHVLKKVVYLQSQTNKNIKHMETNNLKDNSMVSINKVTKLMEEGKSLSDIVQYIRLVTIYETLLTQRRIYRFDYKFYDELADNKLKQSNDLFQGSDSQRSAYCMYKFLEGKCDSYEDICKRLDEMIETYENVIKSY